MRFYTQQHRYYCGIDLHARSMYVCVLDHKGQTVVHRKLPTEPAPLLRLLKPYRKGRGGRGGVPFLLVLGRRSTSFWLDCD